MVVISPLPLLPFSSPPRCMSFGSPLRCCREKKTKIILGQMREWSDPSMTQTKVFVQTAWSWQVNSCRGICDLFREACQVKLATPRRKFLNPFNKPSQQNAKNTSSTAEEVTTPGVAQILSGKREKLKIPFWDYINIISKRDCLFLRDGYSC